MAPSPPLAGWRVGSPRPASPLLPRQGDEVIAPLRGTRSRCPAGWSLRPCPAGHRPPTPSRPRQPGPTMTERCSLWSALSAAACCFYRGSFVQVQVRGRLGPRHARRAGTPGRSARGPRASRGAAAQRRPGGSGWAGPGRGRGRPSLTSGRPGAPRGEGSAATPGTPGCSRCRSVSASSAGGRELGQGGLGDGVSGVLPVLRLVRWPLRLTWAPWLPIVPGALDWDLKTE